MLFSLYHKRIFYSLGNEYSLFKSFVTKFKKSTVFNLLVKSNILKLTSVEKVEVKDLVLDLNVFSQLCLLIYQGENKLPLGAT